MLKAVVLLGFVAMVYGAGGYHDSSVAEIVNFENYNSGADGYRYQ